MNNFFLQFSSHDAAFEGKTIKNGHFNSLQTSGLGIEVIRWRSMQVDRVCGRRPTGVKWVKPGRVGWKNAAEP